MERTALHGYDLEGRVGRTEARLDRLLDPELGIYAKLNAIESRLKTWAIVLLTTVLAGTAVQVFLVRVYGR